jgi:oligopeptidase B
MVNDSRSAQPPAVERHAFRVEAPHGATRDDAYYWLRDDTREDPAMLAWLEAENTYADSVMAPLDGLKERLYAELVGRLKQDDSSVPYQYKDYSYYTRYEEGQEYPIHARRRGTMDADEEVLLNLNELAVGHEFYAVATRALSPDQSLLAYLEDTVGRRQYTLRVKDLDSGEVLPLAIEGLSSSLAWSADSRTIYFVKNDPETLLSKWVKAHTLGRDPADAPVVYEEPDEAFFLGVSSTRSESYICIEASSTVSQEDWLSWLVPAKAF